MKTRRPAHSIASARRAGEIVHGENPNAGVIAVAAAGACINARLDLGKCRGILPADGATRLMELCEQIEDDESARMLAITGTGASFCAGFAPDVDSRVVESLAVLSKPTLAIINGDALDEGLELAMAADIRVAVKGARLGLTQVRRGVMPHFGGTQRLTRLAGIAPAMRMLLTGAPIDATEAARIGLVTYLADNRTSLGEIAGQVTQAILSRGPAAVRLVKDAVRKGYDMTLEQGIRLEEDLYALLQTTADRAEGVRAFLEKRKPLFRGS